MEILFFGRFGGQETWILAVGYVVVEIMVVLVVLAIIVVVVVVVAVVVVVVVAPWSVCTPVRAALGLFARH